MKLKRIFLLLLLILLSACGGQEGIQLPADATAVPVSLITATVGAAAVPATATTRAAAAPSATPSDEPTAAPPPTATTAPSPTGTSTPALESPTAPAATPVCRAVFLPVGFTSPNSLVGLLNVDGVSGAWLQVLDLQRMAAKTLRKSGAVINVAALSPDGTIAAWALPSYFIQLIHIPDGKVTATLTGHTAMVNALLFSPDGSRLYSAGSDQRVIVWDIKKMAQAASFQPIFSPDGHHSEVLGLGISPDGRTLVTIPSDGSARTWDTATFQNAGEYPGIISGGYNGAQARYSPDGKYLAIGLAGGPGDTSLWQVAGSSKLWSGGMMAGFDFSPDSRLFTDVEQDENGRYQIAIRSEDGQTVYRTIPPTAVTAAVWKLMFSPDSRTLAAIDGNVLRFWNTSDGSVEKTYNPPCP